MSTTNITDLPQAQQTNQQPAPPVQQMQTQPQVTFSPPHHNTQLPASAHTPSSNAPPTQHPQLTPQMQTEILSSIQNASRHGGTDLPSRDIPQQTANLVQDPQIHPNYVPPAPVGYIGEQNSAGQVQHTLQQ